ncbi:hypothetical protein K4K59_012853 [Colletotrichum sp. SAR11_240]|nr:hypothetical protein K4K59_012853 [Colletotrichum sp. SAR11_240]
MKTSPGLNLRPDFWILYTQRLELLQRVTVFMAHVDALEAAASEAYHQIINFEDWATDLKPHKYYPTRFLALVELERIARRCAFSDTPARSAILRAKLQFNYSNFGREYLDDGIRVDHQRMRLTMAELYCSGLENNSVWDPVLGGTNPDLSYRDSTLLFPYRSRDNMLRIFDCPSDHVNMADNGLFLPPSVSRAIKEGVLAIVPDLGMEPPSDIDQTQTELFEKRFNDWLDQNVQDYQLIVINVAHPLVQDTSLPAVAHATQSTEPISERAVRKARGRRDLAKMIQNREKGLSAAAIRTPRPEMNSHEKLENALSRLSQTIKNTFSAGFYFGNARPLEAGVSDNLCRSLGLDGLQSDRGSLAKFARTLMSEANNLKYSYSRHSQNLDGRRKDFFVKLSKSLVTRVVGGGTLQKNIRKNPIHASTCDVMLEALVQARLAYLRMDIKDDGGTSGSAEGTYTRKATSLVRAVDEWISTVQSGATKPQPKVLDLAEAIGQAVI